MAGVAARGGGAVVAPHLQSAQGSKSHTDFDALLADDASCINDPTGTRLLGCGLKLVQALARTALISKQKHNMQATHVLLLNRPISIIS